MVVNSGETSVVELNGAAGLEVSSGETGVLELGATGLVVTVLELGAAGVKVLVTMLVVAVVVE